MKNFKEPLAYRMRPQNIDEVIGQTHLVGAGKVIRRMVKSGILSSMIFFGPPGIGKTSLASAIAGSTKYALRKLNAAVNTKKDLQIVAEEAKISGKVILLIDEIHRLEKPKQDFLLPHLEAGTILLIGASTENPYFALTPALRSRLQIFELFPLQPSEIKLALIRAITDKNLGLGNFNAEITDEALNFLANSTNGDLRNALNALELAVVSSNEKKSSKIKITLSIMEDILQKKSLAHDKDGDEHYDTISALQKSIRGSDVDAALFYAAKLIEAGDLPILLRRLLVVAYEDVGLANPQASARTVAAVTAAQKLGLPEARIPIANAIIDLALSPKSNSAYLAIDSALKTVRSGKKFSIPEHLRDTHYQGAKDLGHGVGYKYPHDYPQAFIKQEYLPKSLRFEHFYEAKDTGKYEQALKLRRKQLLEWKKSEYDHF